MRHAILAALALLAVAGEAQAQQTRSYCNGALQVTANLRIAMAFHEYILAVHDISGANVHRQLRLTFAPPPPVRAVNMPGMILPSGSRRQEIIGREERRADVPPTLARERILDNATITCAPIR